MAGSSDSTLLTATLTNLEANVSYDVQVRAENDEGEGAWSNSGTASPEQPLILIRPTAIEQKAGDALADHPIEKLIDGSGLSATPTADNYASVTHALSTSNDITHWVTDTSAFPSNYFDHFNDGTNDPQFKLTLAGTVRLTALVVWGIDNNNEASNFTVEFSADGGQDLQQPYGDGGHQ